MKKSVAILLATVLLLLTGCGQASTKQSEAPNTESVAEVPEKTASTAEMTEQSVKAKTATAQAAA